LQCLLEKRLGYSWESARKNFHFELSAFLGEKKKELKKKQTKLKTKQIITAD